MQLVIVLVIGNCEFSYMRYISFVGLLDRTFLNYSSFLTVRTMLVTKGRLELETFFYHLLILD